MEMRVETPNGLLFKSRRIARAATAVTILLAGCEDSAPKDTNTIEAAAHPSANTRVDQLAAPAPASSNPNISTGQMRRPLDNNWPTDCLIHVAVGNGVFNCFKPAVEVQNMDSNGNGIIDAADPHPYESSNHNK